MKLRTGEFNDSIETIYTSAEKLIDKAIKEAEKALSDSNEYCDKVVYAEKIIQLEGVLHTIHEYPFTQEELNIVIVNMKTSENWVKDTMETMDTLSVNWYNPDAKTQAFGLYIKLSKILNTKGKMYNEQ